MEPLTGEVFLEPHDKQRYFTLCFVGLGLRTHRHAALILSFPVPLRASGKEKIMKTPIEFDYDLWTTEDGKCMVRVKSTGEVTEVDREVMKVLRVEEKKMRRSLKPEAKSDYDEENEIADTLLSLDSLPDDDIRTSAWLADNGDVADEVFVKMQEAEFIKQLTEREREAYLFCIQGGGEQHEYAALSGLSVSRVCKIIGAIRKKAKKFF